MSQGFWVWRPYFWFANPLFAYVFALNRKGDVTNLMAHAVALARQGSGYVHPNPQVGAVITDAAGKILAAGWHQKYGGLHAEVAALAQLEPAAVPHTMYVTLEPCCHWGKQPPCTEAIIAAGFNRVVVGCLDANPLVAGKGIAVLQAAGIQVEVTNEPAAVQLSLPFRYSQTTGLPWITVKWAATLDGKIATTTGASKWITGQKARTKVHELRAAQAGILTAIGTVLADDPQLNVRLSGTHHQPVRIVVDTHARLPLQAQLVQTACKQPTWLLTCADLANPHVQQLAAAGVEVLEVPEQDGKVDLLAAAQLLCQRGINTLMVEAGGQLVGSLFDLALVNEVHAFFAPRIFGGSAPGPVGGQGVLQPAAGIQLDELTATTCGADVHVHGLITKEVRSKCLPEL